MICKINDEKVERYRVLCLAFANDSRSLKIVRHYGAEDVDYAEEHLRIMSVRQADDERTLVDSLS